MLISSQEIVDRETFKKARLDLLEKEKKLTKLKVLHTLREVFAVLQSYDCRATAVVSIPYSLNNRMRSQETFVRFLGPRWRNPTLSKAKMVCQ